MKIEKQSQHFRIIHLKGPRQSGKTTLMRQMQSISSVPFFYENMDELVLGAPTSRLFSRGQGVGERRFFSSPHLGDAQWLNESWHKMRTHPDIREKGAILCVDEAGRVPDFTRLLKANWDQDRRLQIPLQVVVLGSSPLLMQKKITESLMGRFHVVRSPHWSFCEMRDAFGFNLEQYLFYGGYPGLATLAQDPQYFEKWCVHVQHAVIFPTLEKDIIQVCDVHDSSLLKSFFGLCVDYSGQAVSLTKLLTIDRDAGNTQTLQNYLEMFEKTEILVALRPYHKTPIKQRKGTPKFVALNTAFMSATKGLPFGVVQQDQDFWGRLVETAVGAYLWNHRPDATELFYWSNHGRPRYEIDFVLQRGDKVVAFEVKSGRAHKKSTKSMDAFEQAMGFRPIMVAREEGDISLAEFFLKPVKEWLE